ncbi:MULTISPECIES: hypothetical protein, partial [unclassified Pseudomonas]|uniref:hypothetical protein n=1 Tax=unclassified Pseudomonas TaxID=196821 RepID=UPI001C442C58
MFFYLYIEEHEGTLGTVARCAECALISGSFDGAELLTDRKTKLRVDGRFWRPIIRPTSGAVETENSLRFNELCRFRWRIASDHRSLEGVGNAGLSGAF